MAFVSGLKCRECGRESPAEPLNVCDFCFGPLEVVYDYATIAEAVSRDRIAAGAVEHLAVRGFAAGGQRLSGGYYGGGIRRWCGRGIWGGGWG